MLTSHGRDRRVTHMPKFKPKVPVRSAKRLPRLPAGAEPSGRNAVNYILTDVEHRRVTAELIQIGEVSGMVPTLGRYAKHALLEHNRLRGIERKIRGYIAQLQTFMAKDPALRLDCGEIRDTLRAILETPIAGIS